MTQTELQLAEKLYGVFELFRDSDQFAASSTAQKLRTWDASQFLARATEEWGELTGCIAGTHRHSDSFEDDFLLESGQVYYWLMCAAVVAKKSFFEFTTDFFFAQEIVKLTDAYAEAGIPFEKMLETELQHCREKGYLVNDAMMQ